MNVIPKAYLEEIILLMWYNIRNQGFSQHFLYPNYSHNVYLTTETDFWMLK